MQERTSETYVDKSDWYRGPWDDEPDRIEWRSEGIPRLPCLIVRGPSGALCGYVGVPPGHPCHGEEWGDPELEVHGGITYGDRCQAGGKICHVARPGETEDVWWLGFDCCHLGDYSGMATRKWESHDDPKIRALLPRPPGDVLRGHQSYRPVAYVTREVERLAAQLQRIAKGLEPTPEDA